MTDKTDKSSSDLIIHLETVIKTDSEKAKTSIINEPEVIELSEDDDDASTIAASEHSDPVDVSLEDETYPKRCVNNESPVSCGVPYLDSQDFITNDTVSSSHTFTRNERFASKENDVQSTQLQATSSGQGSDDLTILQSMLMQHTNDASCHKRSVEEIGGASDYSTPQVWSNHAFQGQSLDQCKICNNTDELHAHKKSKQFMNVQQASETCSKYVSDTTNTSPTSDSGYSYHSSSSFGPYSLRPSMPHWDYDQQPNTYWQIRGSNVNQRQSCEPYLPTYMYPRFDPWSSPRYCPPVGPSAPCPPGGPYVPNLRFNTPPYQTQLPPDPAYSINIHMPRINRPSVSHSFVVNTSDSSTKDSSKNDNNLYSNSREVSDDNLVSRVSLVIENRLRNLDENENETTGTKSNPCVSTEEIFSGAAQPSCSQSKKVNFSRSCRTTSWDFRETSQEYSMSKSTQLKQLRNRGKTLGAISKDKRIDKLIRPWPCNACDRKFGSRRALLLHMKCKSVKGKRGHTDSQEEIEQYLDHVSNDFSWYLTPGLDEEDNKELSADEIAFFRGHYKASYCWSNDPAAKPTDSTITIKSESEDTEHSDDCYAEFEEYICYICGESFVDQEARNSHIDNCYKEK